LKLNSENGLGIGLNYENDKADNPCGFNEKKRQKYLFSGQWNLIQACTLWYQ
jgi:hypothetical protein